MDYPIFFVFDPFGAGIVVPVMTVNAVIHFIVNATTVKTRIGQSKSIPATMMTFGNGPHAIAIRRLLAMMDQMIEVGLGRGLEADPPFDLGLEADPQIGRAHV